MQEPARADSCIFIAAVCGGNHRLNRKTPLPGQPIPPALSAVRTSSASAGLNQGYGYGKGAAPTAANLQL